jgi:Fe-S-cluster containining protein
MSFPCTKCGQCCLNILAVSQLSSFHTGDGVCRHYNPDTGCNIYLDRPLVCRIDEGYNKLFSSDIPLHVYYQKNAEVCNELQMLAGLSEQYRIEIKYEK